MYLYIGYKRSRIQYAHDCGKLIAHDCFVTLKLFKSRWKGLAHRISHSLLTTIYVLLTG